MMTRLIPPLSLLLLLTACHSDDDYTCSDPLNPSVYIASGPIKVDSSMPEEQASLHVQARIQVATECYKKDPDKLEIVSVAVVDFDTRQPYLELPAHFTNGVEATPTCPSGAQGAVSPFLDIVTTSPTNAQLSDLCGRGNLGLLAHVKRSGCAEDGPATAVSLITISIQCSP